MSFNLVCWCIRRDKQIDYAVILDRHRWISWLLFHGWLCLRSIINTLVMSFLGGADVLGCISAGWRLLMWLKYLWTNGVSSSSVPSSLAQVVGAGMAPHLLLRVYSRRHSSPSPPKMDPTKPSLYRPTVLIPTPRSWSVPLRLASILFGRLTSLWWGQHVILASARGRKNKN